MRCKHCDATIEHGADRCYRCGTPCQVIPSPPPPPIYKPPFHHRHAFILSAAFVVGSIATFVAGMVMIKTGSAPELGLGMGLFSAILIPAAFWFASSNLKYW